MKVDQHFINDRGMIDKLFNYSVIQLCWFISLHTYFLKSTTHLLKSTTW